LDDHYLAPAFVRDLLLELATVTDAYFGSIVRGLPGPAQLLALDGFRLAAAAKRRDGKELVGAWALHRWPLEG
jgi:hypothetical protein